MPSGFSSELLCAGAGCLLLVAALYFLQFLLVARDVYRGQAAAESPEERSQRWRRHAQLEAHIKRRSAALWRLEQDRALDIDEESEKRELVCIGEAFEAVNRWADLRWAQDED